MEVSVESTSALGREINMVVPAAKVDEQVNSRLQDLARTTRMSGFRPGKVPLRIIKERHLDQVHKEVVAEVIQNAYFDAVEQKELRPAGYPSFNTKQAELGQDLEFSATIEVYPEIEIADLSGQSVTRYDASITDEDVDRTLENLRKQRGDWENVDRAAAKDDSLNIDFHGTINGEEFDGNSAEGIDLELGSGKMIDGFEDELIGLKAGDEKTFDLSFPEDYFNEELAGKPVTFKVKVHSVNEQTLPELDEEFVKEFGVEDGSLDTLKDQIRTNLESDLKSMLRNKLKEAVCDAIVEIHHIDVPTALANAEAQTLAQRAAQQLGLPADFDHSESIEAFKESANKRVSLGLILSEIAKQYELEAQPDKVREKIDELAAPYEDSKAVTEWFYSQEEQLREIESFVLEEAIIDWALDQMTVKDETTTYQDLQQNISN